MTSRTFATRMTCFSLISAIETDLRNLITTMDITNELNLPDDVMENAKNRYKSHFNERSTPETPLAELIEFTDFSDLAKVLHRNKNQQNSLCKSELELIAIKLDDLTQVRNRTCHSRPLEINDINELTEFAITIKKFGNHQWWGSINEALDNLNNPAFALSLQIPPYWKNTKSQVYNNLPLPEFDDTGFLGRKEERIAITNLIYSHTRVISLIGEGGVGKTALAIRCLYDVLETSENSDSVIFDMILWVTLKANRLTASGVVQLRDAIVSTLGLYQDISKNLGIDSNLSIPELLDEISIYMKEFKVLLCIDNLETIDKQEIRTFLAEIPNGSKVLITTRIGLGEIEYRYKLDSLDKKASIDLIRKLSTLLNIESLKKKNTTSLENLVRRLYHNPLLIKWYVLGVGSGKNQEEVIQKESISYQEALKFCFQNLYNNLSQVELEIIKTIACLRNSVSAVELRFILSNKEEIEIAEALHNLNNSSMLKSDSMIPKQKDGIRTYTLTDIASDYLTSISPIDDAFYSEIRARNKELKRHIEESLTEYSHYHLDITTIHATNKDEKICSVYLKQALNLAKDDTRHSEALLLIKKAKDMMPDFSECYRVNAYLLHKSPYKAESEYESAIEYNSKSVIAYYAYSQFLMQNEDYLYALIQIDKALTINQDDESLTSFKALIMTRMGSYPEAIELYEKILPIQRDNAHRKFRISTYQQLVNCYKRYTERLIIDSDSPKAIQILDRIFELFDEMFNSENYDERSLVLFSQILIICDKVDFKNSNVSQTTKFIKIIDDYKNTFGIHNKLKVSVELNKSTNKLLSRSKEKIEEIVVELSSNNTDENQLFKGSIKDLVFRSDNNSIVSYGFILGDDSTVYFFHRGELKPQDVFDKTDDYRGARVGFYPYNEPKGPTAKTVHLI